MVSSWSTHEENQVEVFCEDMVVVVIVVVLDVAAGEIWTTCVGLFRDTPAVTG